MNDAIFSPCRNYRYRLDRIIDLFDGPVIGFCLHNPSTAGHDLDDPTSRRGMDFAARWSASRLIFINPWAGIATNPRQLWEMKDPVGPDNDSHIIAALRSIAVSGGFVVAAWGRVSPPARLKTTTTDRLARVKQLIAEQTCELRVVGFNLDGSPKHPLYVTKHAIPMRWDEPS